ncbi:MAG: 4Fe-4S binding protein [Anaerolineae bacterium]|nr:4Fe-4S binding protein [Anaerolineae bacterium]
MSKRGMTEKTVTGTAITLERTMVTRHYHMTWDLERCVGCQIGPLVCPKEAVIHVEGEIVDGRLTKKPSVDIDPETCVLCGMCEVMCPKNAITLTINGERENPVLTHEAFPKLVESTVFDPEAFDWDRKDFVIMNCPTNVITYNRHSKQIEIDQEHCIRCRQCEVASDGAFTVVQPWIGRVELRREKCVEGCLACADICPTRALHIDEETNELVLADYYCIKCGACMQVCPIKPQVEEYESSFESQGVTKSLTRQRITNTDDLPIWVERWRIRHEAVDSAAWLEALSKMADDKAESVEIDRKRALRRKDLLKVLAGAKLFLGDED